MELEAHCDELLQERDLAMQSWAEAKVGFDNLKDRSEDLLSSIMDEVESKDAEHISEAKLKRLAQRTETWKEHKSGIAAARSMLLESKIRLDRLRKDYELTLMKYTKS